MAAHGIITTNASPYGFWRDEFAEMLDPRTHPLGWLDAQVWGGKMQVWGDDGGCILTEIRIFPTGAFEVHIMIAAGDMKHLVNAILPEIEEWADSIDALFVSVASRAGWAKVLKPRGYEPWQQEVRLQIAT